LRRVEALMLWNDQPDHYRAGRRVEQIEFGSQIRHDDRRLPAGATYA
jgi:hypothetical protein